MVEISVVIPLYNRAWAIGECLGSIGLPGDGTVEAIVVDDGSSDGSAEAARRAARDLGIEPHVRVIEQANAGPGAARNRAATEAQGEWLVFLDSDDLWFPWTLPTLREALAGDGAGADLAFFRQTPFREPGELARMAPAPVQTVLCPDIHAAVACETGLRLGSCNAAIRRTVFEAQGGFTEKVRCAEDTDLWLRAGGPTLLVTSPALVALRSGEYGQLTGDIAHLVEGLNWKIDRNAAGLYAGPEEARARFMAHSAVWTIAQAFARGYPGTAYALYLRHLPRLVRAGLWRYVWRFPLRPVLHLRRPEHNPFRLRPARRR